VNPSTPASVFKLLAKDKQKLVRYYVAYNPSTPKPLRASAFASLMKDKDELIRSDVARNPLTPASMLKDAGEGQSAHARLRRPFGGAETTAWVERRAE
jgi:hypothetical protein